jgi:hypothetical protein
LTAAATSYAPRHRPRDTELEALMRVFFLPSARDQLRAYEQIRAFLGEAPITAAVAALCEASSGVLLGLECLDSSQLPRGPG